MLFTTLVVGPFQCNCRILVCARTGEGVLIDPGDEPKTILHALEKMKTPTGMSVKIQYLLHTHGHLDHIGATREVKKKITEAQIALHRADDPLYQQLKMQGSLFGLQYDHPVPVEHYLEEEESLQVGELKLTVLHTPGHSPGSVSFRLHENQQFQIQETVFSGDTLFQGSVGRTDLWGANSNELFQSIRNRLLTLDDDTLVCPGHGPDTFIGIEKRSNPFLQSSYP